MLDLNMEVRHQVMVYQITKYLKKLYKKRKLHQPRERNPHQKANSKRKKEIEKNTKPARRKPR